LALFCGLSTLTRFDAVNAEAVQAPLRLRFNTDLLKRLVNNRDQEFFVAFTDLDATNVEEPLKSLNFSLSPLKGNLEDWDADIQLSKEDFGVSSDNMKVNGKATLADGTEFTFTAPISAGKLQYSLGSQNI
jgi:hypothetical protein